MAVQRSMIQLLMGRLRDELADGDGEGGEEGGPRTVVLDEDRCAVSVTPQLFRPRIVFLGCANASADDVMT